MKNFFNSLWKLFFWFLLIVVGSWFIYFNTYNSIEEYKIKNEWVLIKSEIVSQKEWKQYEWWEILKYSPIVKIMINWKVSIKELDELKEETSFKVWENIELYYLDELIKSPKNMNSITSIIVLFIIWFWKVFLWIYFIKNFKNNSVIF